MIFIRSLIVISVYIISQPLAANPVIDVLTNDHFVITGADKLRHQGMTVKVHNFDDPQRLLNQFKRRLSPNASLRQNKAMILQRFNQLGKKNLQQQFMTAYQGVIVGTQHNITRFPAVLFNDGQAVIYGVTHLPEALTRYQRWKAEAPQ